MSTLFVSSLSATLAFMFCGWVLSFVKDDVSVVDILWGPACAINGVVYFFLVPDPQLRAILVLGVVLLWAVRLGGYVAWRNHGKPEDRRYQAMREANGPGWRWRALVTVFCLQGVLAFIIALPLYGTAVSVVDLGWLDYAGLVIAVFGLWFESVADLQMAAFQSRDKNASSVMDQGLWKYSRHPNYFGEFCVWWGLWLCALSAGFWWTVIGPALLTFFLLKVSGIGLTEKTITKRRPEYQAYIDRTSAFIPRLPRS